MTSFIVGDSYAQSGQFSTATAIFRAGSGAVVVGNLERMTVVRDGEPFNPANRNFWGVTFVDDRHFYATMGSGNDTNLVRGDLETHTLVVVHRNVECPSVSADGRRIAFKKRQANGDWRFTVLDLATGRDTPLAEHRSVDDQIAWADSSHVLYGEAGSVWILPTNGSGGPRILLVHASSPTLVR